MQLLKCIILILLIHKIIVIDSEIIIEVASTHLKNEKSCERTVKTVSSIFLDYRYKDFEARFEQDVHEFNYYFNILRKHKIKRLQTLKQ